MGIFLLWCLIAVTLFGVFCFLSFLCGAVFRKRQPQKPSDPDWEIVEFATLSEERPKGAKLTKTGKEVEVIGFASRDGKQFISNLVPGCWSIYVEPEHGKEFSEDAISVFGMVSEESKPNHLGFLPLSAVSEVKSAINRGDTILIEPTEIGWKRVSHDAFLRINILVKSR